MNNFKYLKVSKNKQIRYLINNKNLKERTYVIFLHGFMSNIEGKKPKTIYKYAKKDGEFSGTCASQSPFLNKDNQPCGLCGKMPEEAECKKPTVAQKP